MRHRPDPRRPRSIATISLVVAIGLFGRSAHAQNAEAEALFNDGEKRMAEHKLAEACDAFDASNRVESRAGTLIRLGECREQANQLASAWSAYKDALKRVQDPKKRAVAEARAAALEPRLSYLTISVSDESRIDGLAIARNGKVFDPILWNRALPVDGGEYIISGRAPGHEEWQTTAKVPVDNGKVSVEVPKFKELGKLVTAETKPADKKPSEPAVDDVGAERGRSPGMFTTKSKIAVGLAAVGVAGVVLGIVFGQSANSKHDQAFMLCPDPAVSCTQADKANALIADGRTSATEANVSFVVAGAAIIGATVLWFTGKPESPTPRHASVMPAFTPSSSGIAVVGTF